MSGGGYNVANAFINVFTNDKTDPKGITGKLVGALSGLGLGAIISKSVSDGMDVQAGQSKLVAQLGLTKTQSGVIGKAAGKLFSGNYGTGMEQIQDALKNVTLNIGGMRNASEASLTNIGTKALNTANIFDQDLGGVTKAVGQMMKTGLAKNADEAFDIVTRGFQMGADKSDDFLDTLNEYGTQFRKMGIDGATATGIISQGLQAGARDGDLVADAIKEFSIRAIDGSTTTAAGFKALGMDAGRMGHLVAAGGDRAKFALSATLDQLRAMPDPVKRAQAATALFGTQAEDLGQALFAIHPEKAAAGLGKIKGAADEANKAFNDNARANIGAFFRQLQGAAINIVGAKVIPVLTDLSGKLSNSVGPAFKSAGVMIRDTTSWLRQHWGLIKGVLTVIAPAVIAYKAWTTAIKVWQLVTKVATAVQLGFNAVMSANPIMLVVIGLGLLVGAVILAYQKVGWFRDLVNGAFRVISTAAGVMWRNGVKPALDGMITGWRAVSTGVAAAWNNVIGPVIRAVIGGFLTMVSTIIHGAASAFGWVPGLGGKLKSAARAVDGFRDQANAALAGITRSVTINANTGPARNAISDLVREAGNKTAYIHVVTIGGPGGVSGGRQAFAKGGFPDNGEFTVGEEGPEIMRKKGSRLEVLSNRQSHKFVSRQSQEPSKATGTSVSIAHLSVNVDAADLRDAARVLDVITDAARLASTGVNQEIM